jgi:hypothetical protein
VYASEPSSTQHALEIAERISREFNERLCRFMGRALLPMRSDDFRRKLEAARSARTLD